MKTKKKLKCVKFMHISDHLVLAKVTVAAVRSEVREESLHLLHLIRRHQVCMYSSECRTKDRDTDLPAREGLSRRSREGSMGAEYLLSIALKRLSASDSRYNLSCLCAQSECQSTRRRTYV
jgi:hypothetical protein